MGKENSMLYPGELLVKGKNYPMLTYFKMADPSKPLVVFMNAVAHLPRVAYATGDLKDEDFPGFWLVELGFSYLVVSYPVEHPIYDTVYPFFSLRDWGEQISDVINSFVVENNLSGNLILMPWAASARVLNHLVNKISAFTNLNIDFICAINGTPALPVLEGLNMHIIQDDLGMANINDSLGESYFCPCIEQQNVLNKKEVMPLDVYREYLVNFPVALIGTGLRCADSGRFEYDPYIMSVDYGMHSLVNFPMISFIMSDPTVLPFSTLNHNLTDFNTWRFMIYAQLLDNKLLPNMPDIKLLDDSKWQDLLDFVRKIPEKLSYDIPGNLFSFIGEVGSKLIAQHVLDLTKKVPVVEKELKEYLSA